MDDFKNSYQNEDATGKKMFIKLWLHAYSYTFKKIVAVTEVPEWAKEQEEEEGEEESEEKEESLVSKLRSAKFLHEDGEVDGSKLKKWVCLFFSRKGDTQLAQLKALNRDDISVIFISQDDTEADFL